MLYGIIRIFLGVLIFGSIGLGIFKSKVRRKKAFSLIFAILSIITISISALFPVENLFITFDSPEEVFYYTCIGEVKDVIYGEQSCMIVYSTQNNTYSYAIIPKTEEGYKISSILSNMKLVKILKQGNSAEILSLKGTTDYYLWATFISENSDIIISDSINSSFKSIANTEKNINTFISYGFIDELDSNYRLFLDNEEIFNLKKR